MRVRFLVHPRPYPQDVAGITTQLAAAPQILVMAHSHLSQRTVAHPRTVALAALQVEDTRDTQNTQGRSAVERALRTVPAGGTQAAAENSELPRNSQGTALLVVHLAARPLEWHASHDVAACQLGPRAVACGTSRLQCVRS